MDYKNSYFAEFTKEVTTIDIDYIPYERGADGDEVALNENFEPVTLIRASRYCSKKWDGAPNYDIYINELTQNTLGELTLLPDEVLGRMVLELEQLNEHINEAWEVWREHKKLWNEGKFSAYDFEWKFFGYFNIPKTSNAGIVGNPNFEKGITTSGFFWDIQDAMMYKQGAILRVLQRLKEQRGIASKDEPKKISSIPREGTERKIKDVRQAYHRYAQNSKLTFSEIVHKIAINDADGLIISGTTESIKRQIRRHLQQAGITSPKKNGQLRTKPQQK